MGSSSCQCVLILVKTSRSWQMESRFSSHYRKYFLPQTHPDMQMHPDTPIPHSPIGAALLSGLSSLEEPGCSELLQPVVCNIQDYRIRPVWVPGTALPGGEPPFKGTAVPGEKGNRYAHGQRPRINCRIPQKMESCFQVVIGKSFLRPTQTC